MSHTCHSAPVESTNVRYGMALLSGSYRHLFLSSLFGLEVAPRSPTSEINANTRIARRAFVRSKLRPRACTGSEAMNSPTLRAVLLVASASTLHAQTAPTPPLFTRNDAMWSAVFLAGSIALSTADVRITRAWTDSSHHSDSRNNLARNVSKVQEGALTVGNLALWGIARLVHAPAMADITFHAAESVVAGSIVSQVIRGPLGRARPYASGYNNQYD